MTDGAEQEPATAEQEAPEPSIKDQVLEQMGGWQGMVYSTLPVVVFVPVNALWGLGWASAAALGAALLVLVLRLATRTSVQPAVSGFFGVAACVLIALMLGGRWYFLYGIVSQAVFALAFAVSIVIGKPLVGVLWHFFRDGDGTEGDWRERPAEKRMFTWLTVMWTLVFLVRFVVKGALFLKDDVNWLGVATIVMGWPMFAAALLVTFLGVRRVSATRAPAENAGEA
ncbi:DUF3159 domain-containing protein [Tsukamurella paurometabola]|uniref:DUF3159 domain-containing protein n=1 Tax=Tsukamurella paurometabola TaxID=2061 RepID=A0ABS5N832_TSUPA|nr:DUF3159 domain-containing protein [Tsukamurella paurometabola]MBS4100442.1 DUF3159 domain-containing protein [Tsukamurella paurometabola]UEA83892.1 DUF3159 domain-containing protein [Tsukamurella paurometabola]